MTTFMDENRRAYELLLKIEVIIRELVKSSMQAEFGTSWQKRIPGELLKKIKESQREENRPNFDFAKLGPLYYLTFGELLTLLAQRTGQNVAKKFGGEIFLKQLENLFPPRNAVCHARPVSSIGLSAIESLYAQMEHVVGEATVNEMMATPDAGLFPDVVARLMEAPLRRNHSKLHDLPACLESCSVYERAKVQYWWGDHELAGFNCNAVDSIMSFIAAYNALPCGVGSAALRYKAVNEGRVSELFPLVIAELEKVGT